MTLLEQQDARLQEEAQIIELRREFLRTKVAYWRAIKRDDVAEAERLDIDARALAERLKKWSLRYESLVGRSSCLLRTPPR